MNQEQIQSNFRSEAERWAKIGVPYRHRGTNERGCDCTGMLIGIANSLGYLKSYILRMYPHDWNLHAAAGNYICEELEKFGNEIPNSEATNGDVAVFRFGKCLAHAGVITNIKSGIFAHSFLTAGKCQFAMLKNSPYSKRWVKTYRLDDEKMSKFN